MTVKVVSFPDANVRAAAKALLEAAEDLEAADLALRNCDMRACKDDLMLCEKCFPMGEHARIKLRMAVAQAKAAGI